MKEKRQPDARSDAIVALSTLIGAMTLARIASDSPLSEEILDRARDHLHRYASALRRFCRSRAMSQPDTPSLVGLLQNARLPPPHPLTSRRISHPTPLPIGHP